MTQTEDNRIRRLYTMDNLPVSWHTDSDLGASPQCIDEYLSGEIASPLGGFKKSWIGRKRELKALANYARVENVTINIRRR